LPYMNHDRKIELFSRSEVFSTLPIDDIKVLAQHSGELRLEQGQLLFGKGSKSRSFYIIDQGEIAISHQQEIKQEEDILARFVPGDVVGEFEFFEEESRLANGVAHDPCCLLVFPGADSELEQLLVEYAHIFAKVYHRLIAINASRLRQTHKLISEKTSWLEEIKKQMFFDKLTGVYNRAYLEDELTRNLSSLGELFSVLVMKPDNFKLINDTFGHEVGDAALQSISARIQSNLRPQDLAIRFRGNEFVVLLPHSGLEEAQAIARQFLDSLNSFDIGMAIGNQSLRQSFSIGIACYPQHENDLIELAEKAFARVFYQRELGGNGIQIAETDLDEIYEFLKSIAIFSNLKLSELQQLARYLKPVTFDSQTTIFRAKEPGDELYIIQSGNISVKLPMPDGTLQEIAEIKSGDFVGEMAIFENAPRSATCTAKEECRIYTLHKDDFLHLMKESPNTAIRIMKNMLDITSGRVNASGKFISQMVKWGEEASRRAVTDKLTGVYNRRFLESELEKIFERSKAEQQSFALIMADMDYFREVNEGYSHEIGDKYIIEVANVFKKYFRPQDIVARYGGDEFTILLPDIDREEAMAIAENVRIQVGSLDFLKKFKGPELRLSVSLGLTIYPEVTSDIKELTKSADEALYKAKKGGRNQVVLALKSE